MQKIPTRKSVGVKLTDFLFLSKTGIKKIISLQVLYQTFMKNCFALFIGSCLCLAGYKRNIPKQCNKLSVVWKHEAALQRQKIRNLEAKQYRRSEAYRAESRRLLAELEAQLCKAEKDKDTARCELLETHHPCWSCRQRKTGLNSRNADCLSLSFTVLLYTYSSTKSLTRR